MKKLIDLGSCRIKYGKHTRNHFIYFSTSQTLDIDFDSDFSLWLKIKLKNPSKALEKAKKIVSQLLDKDVTVEEFVKLGFEHNVPKKYLNDDSN